ncbi:MAG: hypothetical protein ACR2GK_01750 [Gemmatimonadaceae bacterium]
MLRSVTVLVALAAYVAHPPRVQEATHHTARFTDTVYVKQALDYDELARRVAVRLASRQEPTIIEGDLIVKGRLGVGGEPEPGTDYAVTIRGPGAAAVRLIANEALLDPQREGTQHRHVGVVGISQDGGLRLDQNSTCFIDERGCTVDDKLRRRAYSGFDSMGDMSFYLSDVDSVSGRETAPTAQSLVFRLLDWDGNIHIHAHRPGQRIFFNTSTTLHAADLQWEVPAR